MAEALPTYTQVNLRPPGHEDDPPEEEFGFDAKFLKRFFRLHKVFMKKWSFSAGITLVLILVALFQEFMIFKMGVLPSEFFKVLTAKDLDAFIKQTLWAILVIAVVSFASSSKAFIQKVLTVEWRKLICGFLHKLYLRDITYYDLNILDKNIDNPDQRMTQDVDKFTDNYSEVLVKLVVSPVTIIYYSYQTFVNTGWPGLLTCFGYFIVSAIVNKYIMNPIVSYVVKLEEREGDFRFNHMMIRVHSEPIAFLDAAPIQGGRLKKSLDLLIHTQFKLYLRQYLLNTSVNLFIYLGSILSYLLMSIPIFSGALDHLSSPELSGLISKNVFVTFYLIYQFTSLIKTFGNFTEVAGVCHRIVQLVERMNYLNEKEGDDDTPDPRKEPKLSLTSDLKDKKPEKGFDKLNAAEEQLNSVMADLVGSGNQYISAPIPISPNPLAFKLTKVTIESPYDGQVLVRDLSLEIRLGEPLIIVGPSSAGKSSLLRVLRGLWSHGGSVLRFLAPGPEGAFFFTQKPFLTSGSLRDQICFPLEAASVNLEDDKEIQKYFELVDLGTLIERVGGLDSQLPWTFFDNLSPGEAQRLCFIRIFIHKPKLAVLDEATSALPTDMEEIVYKECERLGITCLSVAHRPTLKKFHRKQLRISGKGNWELTNLPPEEWRP